MRTTRFPVGHAGNSTLLSLDTPSHELHQDEEYFKTFRHLTQLFLKKELQIF